jgi:hypothetical protein
MIRIIVWWRWYITTVTILYIIHRPVSYLKHDISETGLFSTLGEAFLESKGSYVS